MTFVQTWRRNGDADLGSGSDSGWSDGEVGEVLEDVGTSSPASCMI